MSSPSFSSASILVGVGVVGAALASGLAFKRRGNRKSSADADVATDFDSAGQSVTISLPLWAVHAMPEYQSRTYRTDEEMMSLAVHLSDRNVAENTGGPFGAAIFERHFSEDGSSHCTLISVGMNRVVPLGNSTLHGETVAIQLAQRKVGSFSLCLDYPDSCTKCEGGGEGSGQSAQKKRQFELFTSCEPCAMCLGATLWSGVSRIVCGATKSDAQAIGFDEGPVFEQSYEHLEKAGIKVTRGVLKDEAAKVLKQYGEVGLIYNR